MSGRSINELERVEFKGSLDQAFGDYAHVARTLARRLAFELEAGAGDSQAAMSRLHGHPLLLGLDARWRARQVAKRLKRATELAHGIAEEARKFHRDYRRQFLDI